MANRFELLAQALDALARGLGDRFRETRILVMSEFGRTVRQNGTGGTDHGHGNVAFLMGAGVRGGRVHGEWPGLDSAIWPAARILRRSHSPPHAFTNSRPSRTRLLRKAERGHPVPGRRQPAEDADM